MFEKGEAAMVGLSGLRVQFKVLVFGSQGSKQIEPFCCQGCGLVLFLSSLLKYFNLLSSFVLRYYGLDVF